jgi:ATP-dependent Clp protease adaptor protein ClpS
MGSTTIALIILLAAVGAWMWWRTRRMPALPAAQSAASPSTAADDLALLRQVPAEYAGRADLQQLVLLNDDLTPMDLVIVVLKSVFKLPDAMAFGVTLAAHTEGECVIAVLPADVAAERITAANEIAKESGNYPLQIVARPLVGGAEQWV